MDDVAKMSDLLESDLITAEWIGLSECDLPPSAKDWLATIGVPRKTVLPFGLDFVGSSALKHFENGSGYGVIIGETEGPCYFVIRSDGAVLMVDGSEEPARFVNSSVQQFLVSQCEFKEFVKLEVKVDEFEDAVHGFESRLIGIDPDAVRSEHEFWSLVVEDMINMS